VGGKSSTSSSQTTIPANVLQQYNQVNANAEQVAQTPFQQYGGQFVAPVNSTESSAINNITADANEAQPYYQAATGQLQQAQSATQPYYAGATGDVGVAQAAGNGLANASLGELGSSVQQASPITTQQINQYLSPYLTDVAGTESQLLSQENQQAQAGQLGNAITSGAFGGDRAGIAAANLNQQNQLSNANILSGILNTGYNTALSTAQQQQGVGISAAQTAASQLASLGQQQYTQGMGASNQLATLGQDIYNTGAATSAAEANLGAGAQSAALSGAQAQLAAGQVSQQTQQAQDTAEYNQFLQQQAYPFQTAQFLANIAEGTGALSGSTTTSTTPGGLFSDRRLKENIRKVGKLKDGQTIYSYNYKGDNVTHIGLMADEVEKKHPEAVGLSAGYKTVDYDKATEDSAERKRYAVGGLAGYGDSNLGAITQAEQQMFSNAGLGAAGMGGGGVRGGSSYVPQANLPVQSLHAAPAPQPTQSGLTQATQLANFGNAVTPGVTTAAKWAQGLGKASQANDNGLGSGSIDFGDDDVDAVWRGGRLGRAIGGATDDDPYQSPDDLDIPDDQPHAQLNPAPAPKPASGGLLGGLGQLFGIGKDAAGIVAAMNTGGSVPDADDPESSIQSMLSRMFGDLDNGDKEADDGDSSQPDQTAPVGPTGLAPPAAGKPPSPVSAPLKQGLGQGLDSISSAIKAVEGTGKNPNSSARGPYQLIDPTWLGMFKQTFPDRAQGMSDKQILAIRNTPQGDQISAQLGPELARRNIQTLQSNGIQPNAPNVYLAHFLGPQAAMRVINSDPTTPVEKLIPSMDISANRFLKGKTAGDVLDWSANALQKAQSRQGFADGGAPDGTDVDSDDVDFDPNRDSTTSGAALPAPLAPAPNPSTAVPATPTGLASPQPADTSSGSAPQQGGLGGFAHDTLQNLKKPEVFIPLLTGLAAWAGAPTQHPLVALAQGLGAAGQSYQGQRQFVQQQLQQNRDYSIAQQGVTQKGQQIGIEQQLANVQSGLMPYQALHLASGMLPAYMAALGQRFQPLSDVDKNGQRLYVDRSTNETINNSEYNQRYMQALGGVFSSGLGGQNNVAKNASPVPSGDISGGSTNGAGSGAVPTVPVNGNAPAPSGVKPVAPVVHDSPVQLGPNATATQKAAAGRYMFQPQPLPPVDTSQLRDDSNPESLRTKGMALKRYGDPSGQSFIDQANQIETGAVPAYTTDGQPFYGYQQRAQAQALNAHVQSSYGDQIQKQNGDAQDFASNYAPSQQLLNSLKRLYSTTDTNRLSEEFSNLIGTASSVPGLKDVISPELKQYQAATDEAHKDAARQAIVQAVASHMANHAPAAALHQNNLTVPGPNMAPAARYNLVVQTQAMLDRSRDFFKDWNGQKNKIQDVSSFATDWANEHPIDQYEQHVYDRTPAFAGMTPAEMQAHPLKPKSPADLKGVRSGVPFQAPDGRILWTR